MTFLEMSEQERIEALTSGVNSTGLKAATLWTMEKNIAYTCSELSSRVYGFLESRPASFRMPHDYCMKSLQPAGMVARIDTERQPIAFQKTRDGFRYGDPSIARFLYAAGELGISLNQMNKHSQSAGSVKHGYIVSKILECLSDGSVMRAVDISQRLGIASRTAGQALASLQASGFIDYDSTRLDSWGGAQRGYARVVLVDKRKTEFYMNNNDRLRAAVLEKTPTYTNWGCLDRVLSSGKGELEHREVSEEFRMHRSAARHVISALVHLGVYDYEKFRSRVVQSSAIISPNGKFLFDNVYGPIIDMARSPRSRSAMKIFEGPIRGLNMPELLAQEIERYGDQKNSADGSKTNAIVYEAAMACISRVGNEDLRLRDIGDQLRSEGNGMNSSTVSSALKRLARDGQIEEISGRPTRYRMK